jgi:arylformamidase
MNILDISPLLSERIGVWPGDVPFSRRVACSIEGGSNIDLSSITTTVHVGAHVDAPSHYRAGGEAIATRPLARYVGPCQVIRVDVARGGRVGPEHVREPFRAPRVLFRTGTYPHADRFDTDFASLSPALVDAVHAAGGVLVGIDTPSIDPFADNVLEAHQAVARHDLSILEGVVLDHVEPGLYTLVALPLRIEGADASPVRAVLIRGLVTPD